MRFTSMMSWAPLFTAMFLASALGVLYADQKGGSNAEKSENGRTNDDAIRTEAATIDHVTLTIECPKTMVSGAPNHVVIIIQNNGERTIQCSPIFTLPVGFEVVRQPKGHKVDRTAYGESQLVLNDAARPGEAVHIKKGQRIRTVVNLTRYYDLSLIYPHQIVATWIGRYSDVKNPKEGLIKIKTPPIQFEVEMGLNSKETIGPAVTDIPKDTK